MIRAAILVLLLLLYSTAAQALDRAVFEAQARTLMSSPAKAAELLALCEKAVPHADGAGYRAIIHGYVSHALWLTGYHSRAENEARQALALDSDAHPAYFFLSDALNAQGKYGEAYRVCLSGVQRRGGANPAAGRLRCREEYLEHLAKTLEAVHSAMEGGRLAPGQEVIVRGNIAEIGPGTVLFQSSRGRLVCRLAPLRQGQKLHPMTQAEDSKVSLPTLGLRKNQTVILQGFVAAPGDDTAHLDNCVLVQ